VVAAAADIKLGTVLDRSNLTTIDIAGTVPKGAILETQERHWTRRDLRHLPGRTDSR
jgi:Flp pilus assembly protein CpaB